LQKDWGGAVNRKWEKKAGPKTLGPWGLVKETEMQGGQPFKKRQRTRGKNGGRKTRGVMAVISEDGDKQTTLIRGGLTT